MQKKIDFTTVLIIRASDWAIAEKTIPLIRANIRPKDFVIISAESLRDKIPKDAGISFLCEDEVYPGLTLQVIKRLLKDVGGPLDRAGWYLQQMIKLAYCLRTEDEYYLAWDMDTLPIRKIEMFDSISGKPYFNLKPEYFSAYFSTMENLLNLRKANRESFITEHMLFDVGMCRELIRCIENNKDVAGAVFFEKIVNASDFSIFTHAFSEFETYGTFVSKYYPGRYETRHLDTFRPGRIFFGDEPTSKMLEWAAKDFDTISFESWSLPSKKLIKLCSNSAYRRLFSFKNTAIFYYKYLSIRAMLSKLFTNNMGWIKAKEELYNQLRMDYYFCKDPWYKGEVE